ncbi:MAG: esterase/lipase [Hyphomicrobiales bacterium]|nr:esterase/lipase [Hyphomicrobiales bacterium]
MQSAAPKVWRDYHQEALDACYDQSVYAPNQDAIKDRRAMMARLVIERLGAPEVISYGPGANETFELYRANGENLPLAIFVHGGAWRAGRAREFAALAEPFVRAGAHFAILDFDLIQDCGGDLFPMIDQARRATAQICVKAADYGADPSRIHLIGHSSGGHMAGCVATTDWTAQFGLRPDLLRGAMLFSGMYELEPVRLSKRSRYVAFTDRMVEELSAIRRLEHINCPLLLAYGTLETPEFQRQTRDFHAAVQESGKPARLLVGTGYNHFEILETLANPYGLLGQAALEQMGLAP